MPEDFKEIPINSVVRVRSRKYVVESSDPDLENKTQLVTLRCLEDDAQGERLDVIWEHEVDAKVVTDEVWSRVASQGFDQGALFQAYFNTLRWGFVTSTNAELFQSPYRAGIQIQDYQLEPLRRALAMSHVNLFIADDVGLGKTIEAGLILRELIIRQKVRRCVISAPPSVVHQWRDEMEQRFGISFEVYDSAYIAEHRRQRGFGSNPWMSNNFFIISHAMVRRHEHFTLLKEWLKGASASMLILDEAHHAAPASGSLYAIDSKLTQTMRALCSRFTHRLFLSATPHNGHSNSFSTLLELLDPNIFHRGVQITPDLLDKVMVRRLKKDLRAANAVFPERNVAEIEISQLSPDTPELKWARKLQEYWRLREERLAKQGASRRQFTAARLPFILLQKRLLSSLKAFKETLDVHYFALKRIYDDRKLLIELSSGELRRLQEHEGSYHAEEEEDVDEVSEQEHAEDVRGRLLRVEQATGGKPELLKPELVLLEELKKEVGATTLVGGRDPKLERIVEWLREHVCDQIKQGERGGRRVLQADWKPRRLLVFTEYADTKDYLVAALNYLIYGNPEGDSSLRDQSLGRVASYCGGMDDEQRRLVREAFNRPFDHEGSDLRILVATDAAREGINLQSRCYDLFHYDIPWNPGRLEQRNGRIDRKLQPSPVVNCFYFNLSQRVEDRVLTTLVKKSLQIEKELGSFNTVISDVAKILLKEGIAEAGEQKLMSRLELFDQERPPQPPPSVSISTIVSMSEEELEEHETERRLGDVLVRIHSIKEELSVERAAEVKRSLAGLGERLEQARKWIDFDQARLRGAMDAALRWSKLPPLERVSGESGVWCLPSWDEVLGRDPSWVHTLDALRESRKAGQSVDEWREQARLQPVVFEDDGTMRHGVVQLHLEHRVVRRLLQRFVAHGFTQDGLNRATVLVTERAIPSVVLVGRLSLFGEGASRLHDQLVFVEAEFADPSAPLRVCPYEHPSEKLLALPVPEHLKAAMARGRDVSEGLRDALKGRVAGDLERLRPLVESLAEEAEGLARKKLIARADQEAIALENQLKRLKKQLKHVEVDMQLKVSEVEAVVNQPELDRLNEPQQEYIAQEEVRGRQLKVDLQAVQDRLRELTPRYIAAEALKVKGAFEIRLHRVEPVGMLYLWPASKC